MLDRGPHLDVDELAPGLRMVGKPLHERSVAVFAAVRAAHIGVDGEICHRQVGLCYDALDCNLLDLHCQFFPLDILRYKYYTNC